MQYTVKYKPTIIGDEVMEVTTGDLTEFPLPMMILMNLTSNTEYEVSVMTTTRLDERKVGSDFTDTKPGFTSIFL